MNASQLTIYIDGLANDIKTIREAFDKLNDEHKQTLQSLNDLQRKLEVENALLKREVDELISAKLERQQDRDERLFIKREIEELQKWKDDQKQDRDEKARRLWAFGPNIAGAIVTAVLSIVISLATILIVTYFKTPTP